MACLLIVAWATVFVAMIRAVILKDILWPQKQEDRDEGGWQSTLNASTSSDVTKYAASRRRDISSPKEQHTTVVDAERTEEADWTEKGAGGPAMSGDAEVRMGVEGLIDQSVRGRILKPDDDIV